MMCTHIFQQQAALCALLCCCWVWVWLKLVRFVVDALLLCSGLAWRVCVRECVCLVCCSSSAGFRNSDARRYMWIVSRTRFDCLSPALTALTHCCEPSHLQHAHHQTKAVLYPCVCACVCASIDNKIHLADYTCRYIIKLLKINEAQCMSWA